MAVWKHSRNPTATKGFFFDIRTHREPIKQVLILRKIIQHKVNDLMFVFVQDQMEKGLSVYRVFGDKRDKPRPTFSLKLFFFMSIK